MNYLYQKKSNEEIINVVVTDEQIEVTIRVRSGSMYACYPPRPVPDTIYKDIYVVNSGKFVFDKRIEGKHVPEHIVGEQFDF